MHSHEEGECGCIECGSRGQPSEHCIPPHVPTLGATGTGAGTSTGAGAGVAGGGVGGGGGGAGSLSGTQTCEQSLLQTWSPHLQ
mmetsp:Transcript_91406/g.229749  ORF Transcript_91406/g.229749 Transcript_91406/m.229749 type:complete len:84 (+) Transcript_91406:270-521(+)